ncbi:MAG: ABC transporter ATP-binding protein [Nitrospirae bacterium]|nr:ABC transporter ATP-binding protein [Nitrospirota bacterium]
MIVLDHVFKKYGDLVAVNDVCLETKAGEIFGFLGPNGAGKTTAIRMIMGLMKPTSGTITIDGHDIQKDPISAKKVLGYIPDRPFLYEKLTAWEYMKFIAGMYGVEDRVLKGRGIEFLEIFELTDWANELIENFSHGMKQRLCLSAAFMRRPKVMVLDEPVVGLDPRGARLLKEILRTSRDQGMTIFMSTHILEIAEQMCDRIGIIHNGKMIALGTIHEIKEQAHATDSKLEQVFLHLTGGEDVINLIRTLQA